MKKFITICLVLIVNMANGQDNIYKFGVNYGRYFDGSKLKIHGIGFDVSKDIGSRLDIGVSFNHQSGYIKASDVYNADQLAYYHKNGGEISTIRSYNHYGIFINKSMQVGQKSYIYLSLGGRYSTYKDATFGGYYLTLDNYKKSYIIFTTTDYWSTLVEGGYSWLLARQTHLNITINYQTKLDLLGINIGFKRHFSL